jgi:ribonuclease Y
VGPGALRIVWIIIAGVVGILAGGGAVFLLQRTLGKSKLEQAEAQAQQLVDDAEKRVTEIELAAEKQALRMRNEAEEQAQKKLQDLRREDERLQSRRESLDERMDRLEERERGLNRRQSRIDRIKNQIEELHLQQQTELERVANLSQEEAQEVLLKQVEEKVRDDMARLIREMEAKAQAEAEV